ncbi:MAG: hypothetical protein HDT43_10260 [Ruminococcaceae bacterium]|nr:hypothetical protein [Oscillospiraceae bacterium]
MKKVILIILSTVIGAVLVLGGAALGAYMYDISIPHFDNYDINTAYTGSTDIDEIKEMQAANGYGIKYPDFWYANNIADKLIDCYSEVQGAMFDYAFYVARRYNHRARLDPEVECTKTRLTIKFTGYGVLDDGTREDLARTYIFDIEGAGSHKLPKLLNKAEIYPEIL